MYYNKNPNCDNDKCRIPNGQVRKVPLGSIPEHGNLILCHDCFNYEMKFRYERNKTLAFDCRFDILNWEDLEIYNS